MAGRRLLGTAAEITGLNWAATRFFCSCGVGVGHSRFPAKRCRRLEEAEGMHFPEMS
jgi:hypothetical protein